MPLLSPAHPPHKNIGAIIGGTISGVVVLAILLFALFMWRRREITDPEENRQCVRRWGFSWLIRLGKSRRQQRLQPNHIDFFYLPPLAPDMAQNTTAPPPRARKGPSVQYGQQNPVPTPSFQTYSNANASSDWSPTVMRTEVEGLRREIDELRSRGLYEPPPQYG